MTESAVSFLVEKLTMVVEQEAKLLKGVTGEIEIIRGEFEHMKAFLKCAEPLQEDNPELKVWVKQVREVAYDTEDILDDFMLNLAEDHGHGFMRYFHQIKSFIQNLKSRHHISYKIAGIKSRLSSIAKGRQRYHFEYGKEQSASTSTRGASLHDLREDAFLVEEGELVGINEPREQLIEWLVDGEPGLKVVSILGMGGVGKTTLAGRVYNDPRVKASFPNHAWISVSQSYDIENILRDMIAQLHGEKEVHDCTAQRLELLASTSLKQRVKDFLQQKRYVIVLDDVWKLEALDDIKNAMPSSNFPSRMLITTRLADVAAGSSNQSRVYTLETLKPKESWSLFCKKAFHGKPCPPHLEDLSRQILKKCEGLPLAIVAIGGLLFAKDVEQWEMISRNLAAELESNDKMQNFRKILSLSYNDLHYNLRSCFLYLGVFPEDYVIKCTRLIRLWIAEGFVERREGLTQEEVAQRYLKELVNRSLVQIEETISYGKLRCCRVHDLIRKSILSKLRDENFVSFASDKNKELDKKVRRLSVQYTCSYDLKKLNLPSLRSLLIFESGKLSTSDEQFLPRGSKALRVLDLSGSSLHKFPRQIPALFHLKYLSLRGTQVRIIPRSIGKLQNLETLDLRQTLVSELPVEITKLKKLLYLLVYSYTRQTPSEFVEGFSAPQGIGALASLQKLTCVKAGGGRTKNTMRELGELNQLRRLGVMDLKTGDSEELSHSLDKMTNLRSLSATAESESEVINLNLVSSPPPLLRTLNIQGCLKELPRWLPQLNNLVKVSLAWSRMNSSPLNALRDSPNLTELHLIDTFDGERLVFEDRGFPKLKELALVDLENLRFVSMNGQAMPCLQKLIVDGCRHLDSRSFQAFIRGLTPATLKHLEFCEMPDEFARALCNPQEYEEKVIECIPRVYFYRWEEDHWELYDLNRIL